MLLVVVCIYLWVNLLRTGVQLNEIGIYDDGGINTLVSCTATNMKTKIIDNFNGQGEVNVIKIQKYLDF